MRTIAFILCISIYFIYLSLSTQSPPLVKSLSTAFSISVPSLKVYWCLLEQCVFEIQHPTLGYLKWSSFCCSVIQPLKSQWKNWMILVRDSCATKINIYQFVWKTSNHKFVQQGEFPGLKVIPWILSIQYIFLCLYFACRFSAVLQLNLDLFFFCSAGFFHPITLEFTVFRVSILKWWGFLNALPLWKNVFLN